MPSKDPALQQPPFGKTIDQSYQGPKATDLLDDQLLVIHKEKNAPGFVLPTVGDVHPDDATRTLSLIEYSADGTLVKLTYSKARVSKISQEKNEQGQIITISETLVPEGTTPPEVTATTVIEKQENLTNGQMRRTIGTVPEVFPAKSFSAEIPDLVPEKFRPLVPTRSTELTQEGDAQPPDLGPGELARREQEVTEQTMRVSVTSRDTTQLPATLTDQETSSAFGFGGVMDIEQTLDAEPQTVDEGLEVVSSKVTNLGGGLTLKETEKLSGNDGTLELTAGGSGFTSDPTVSFSGGSATGGATATSSVSPITTAPSTDVVCKYAFNGDDQGVFFYLGQLGNNGVWRNPQTNGDIVISTPFDTLDIGTFDQIVDREPSNVYLVERAHAELWFDLKAGRSLLCTHLTYQQRSDYGSACRQLFLQGSVDGVTWDNHTVEIDVSGTDPGKWKQVACDFTTPYRYYRLILGDDSGTFLSIGDFELYGTLTLAGEQTGGQVTAVTVTAGGQYDTAPAVTFTGGGGSGAAGTALMSGTEVVGVQITNPGSGYTSLPTIGFTGGVGGSDPATATATVGYGVASVTIGSGGTDYDSPPTVTFESDDGSGASGYAVLGRVLLDVVLTNAGSDYSSDPTVTISGGGGSGATATIERAFSVASVTITSGGSGYASDPTITAVGGGGSGATFKVTRGQPLGSIVVGAPGSGYSSAPTVTVGGTGTGATGTAVLGFALASITVTSSGSGYSTVPDVAISGGGGGGATATAELIGRAVDSLDVTAGGTYTSKPTVTLQGGDGSGATAAAHMGVTGSPAITAPGTGYVVNDVLTLVGGTGTAATLKVTTVGGSGDITGISIVTPGDYTALPSNPISVTGGTGTGATFTVSWTIVSIAVTAGGSGYSSAPSAVISGAGGGAATVLLTADNQIKITLTNPGAGYTSAPTVTISGGGGTGATATAALASTGSLKSVTLTAAGTGFTSDPPVTFSGGGGSGATATGVRDMAAAGTIAAIDVINPGSGYTSAPSIAITGGSGAGATATAVLSSSGKLGAITLTSPGSGYTDTPAVVISGGSGSGAEARAILAATGSVSSVVITNAGSYVDLPDVIFTGGGGSGAAGTAVLASTGSVVRLTLTHAGTYFTAPTVTISGGAGTGATAVYHLTVGWPVLEEVHTDPTDSVIVLMEKKLVAPGTALPSGFVEVQAVDKWRSIQIVSSVDLHSLPRPETWLSTQHIALPDELLSVTPLWSTSKTQKGGLTPLGLSGSSEATAEVRGSILIKKKSGFRGAALARVERTFFYGPPPDGSVPSPTVIRPSTGTATIIGGSQEAGQGGAIFTPPLNINGDPAQPGDTLQDGSFYAGGGTFPATTTSSGGTSQSIQAVDITDVLTPGYTSVDGFTYQNQSDAGDGSLPSIATATGSFTVDIPPSCPASLPAGSSILSEVAVEKWRFGLFVRTIIYVIVPPDCDAEPESLPAVWVNFDFNFN